MNEDARSLVAGDCKLKNNEELRQIIGNSEYWQPHLVEAAKAELASRKASAVARSDAPLFLYISVSRLIACSLLSAGFYQIYWMYRNWRYLQERENDRVSPYLRGIFAVFFCHSLLRTVYGDTEARAVGAPAFRPSLLATLWVLLVLGGNFIGMTVGSEFGPQSRNSYLELMLLLFPCLDLATSLCLVPVQRYINAVNRARNANERSHPWTIGQGICVGLGLLVYGLVLHGAFQTEWPIR